MKFLHLLAAERLKLIKSYIWLLIPVSPILAALTGVLFNYSDVPQEQQVPMMFSMMSSFHALLLLPILSGIFSSYICRYEHSGGGWKQLLSLPVSRASLYFAKFISVAVLLGITQLLFVGALLLSTSYHGLTANVPWELILSGTLGGWVACLPLAALQLWASISWSSFAAPLVINFMMTVPNMLIVNSATYGPFYPWAQPGLAMITYQEDSFGAFALPMENLLITVLGSLLLFMAGGLLYFRNKEM